MRLEQITEAPAGVGYRGKVAAINQRAAAKKAAIDYSNPKVKEKLAKQNYGKWIKHVKTRRNQIDLTSPENYKAELLKFFSSNGKIQLGNEFKQAVARSKLSKRELLGLVGQAIDARASARAEKPAPAAQPKVEPQADADGQYGMDLRGGSSNDSPRPAPSNRPAPQATPDDSQASFDFDGKPTAQAAPAAEPVAAAPKSAAKKSNSPRPKVVKVSGTPWTWDGSKWSNPRGEPASASMSAAIEAYLKDQNK